MKIYITRHGETDWNTSKKLCGSTDITLNDKGREQARELAEMIASRKDELDIRYIYTSDLERAVETASYTEELLGLRSIQDLRLREMISALRKERIGTATRHSKYRHVLPSASRMESPH